MGTKRHLILSCVTLLSCRTCRAYTGAPRIRIPARRETTEFPSIRRNHALVHARRHRRTTTTMANRMTTKSEDNDINATYDDWLLDGRKQRVAVYTILAVLETIFWYWLAPGIDPQSRWFNPLDGELIVSLLNPETVFSPPVGSGLGFSSLLLNTFLVLPMVWSLLLLQEENDETLSTGKSNIANRITATIRICVCACGFFVGGGILIPYMIFRRPAPLCQSIDQNNFPAPLKLFEDQTQNTSSISIPLIEPLGRTLFLAFVSVILVSFLLPFATHHSSWLVEWNAFLDRAQSSQFTALALYDFTMISIMVLDPMMDDALRRGYIPGWENEEGISLDQWRSEQRLNAVVALLPYVIIPILGPVAWICRRPRYKVDSTE